MIVQRLLADVETKVVRIALDRPVSLCVYLLLNTKQDSYAYNYFLSSYSSRYFPNPALCQWMIARGGDITAMWDKRKTPFPEWLQLASKKPTKKCPKGDLSCCQCLEWPPVGFCLHG